MRSVKFLFQILWPKGKSELESFFFQKLSALKVEGVELALNCFWEEPVNVDETEINWLKELLKNLD